MRKIITIAILLSLSACSTLTANFPTQSEKAVELTQKGLTLYCNKVAVDDRAALRAKINTTETGGVIWCTQEEYDALFTK